MSRAVAKYALRRGIALTTVHPEGSPPYIGTYGGPGPDIEVPSVYALILFKVLISFFLLTMNNHMKEQ